MEETEQRISKLPRNSELRAMLILAHIVLLLEIGRPSDGLQRMPYVQ